MDQLLTPKDLVRLGLLFAKVHTADNAPNEKKEFLFHSHYGSSSLTLALMWYDMKSHEYTDQQLLLEPKEKGNNGLKHFLIAHFVLWTNPKNSCLTSSRFSWCRDYVSGARLWKWIKRIYYLKEKVIKWTPELDSVNGPVFAISIDGVDKKTWEPKHPQLNQDRTFFSKKHAHAALKYQITMAVHTAQCVHFFGPRKGNCHDQTMLEESGVLNRLREGKLAIVDSGYVNNANRHKLSWPNPFDSKEVHNYKARARCRHETMNGRMAFFKILSETYEYDLKTHKWAFGAVCVTVQYQMNTGSPIFRV